MWNLRVIAIILLLISSSFVFASGIDKSLSEYKIVGVEGVLGVDNTEKPSNNSILTTSRAARTAQDDAHGGSWVDSFEDDSGIDKALSDHLRLEGGDAEINGSYSVDPNATAVWHFDEGSGTTAYDETDNDNDGTLKNGVSWTTSGKYNNALDFDGINDYIDLGSPSTLDNLPGNDFTVNAWIYDMESPQSWGVIFGTYDIISSVGYGWKFSTYSDASGNRFLSFHVAFGSLTSVWAWAESTIGSIKTNQWHHVAAVYNANIRKAKLYIDGSEVTYKRQTTGVGTLRDDSGNGKQIGSLPLSSTNQQFKGKIDEVAIYDQELTAKEINDIYKNIAHIKLYQANLTSKTITLPPNMQWETLMINKTQPENTYINLTILNANDNQPIPGSPTYTDNGEVDISYIDPVQYPTIKLNATFEGDGSTTPELHYWAVSWNRSNTWQDTLFGGEKVESSENVEVVDGEVQLAHGGFDDNTVALWHFNEGTGTTAYDETDNDNDGTLKNGVSWTTSGKYGNALSFDGVDDHVDCGNKGVWNFGTSDFTIGAWVKTSDTGDNPIVGRRQSNNVVGIRVDGSNDGKVLFLAGMGGTYHSARGNTIVNDGNWHNIVGVREYNKDLVTYVDGVDDTATTSLDDDVININRELLIGGRQGSTIPMDAVYNGIIDEVAIYNRALSAQEIKDLFQYGSFRHQSFGTLTSTLIPLPTNMCWDTLIINKTEPQDTSLNVTILDGTTNEPILCYQNLTGAEIDILSINPIVHNSIKLKAAFGSTGQNTSILHDWSVNWTENTAPKIVDISSVQIVNRTYSAPFTINLLDLEETEENLTLKIEYRSPSDTIWQTNCITDPYYATDQWNCTFTPTKDAELGLYSFRVTVNDSFQYLNVTTHTDLIEVINNKPTLPNVTISPFEPKTTDDLIVTAENSTDIETPINNLKYWYRWYRNGSYVEEFENTTFIPHTVTHKDESWRCVVYPFDGDEVGLPGEDAVVIQNSPPEIAQTFTSLEMYEDIPVVLENKLIIMFTDIDSDNLTFKATGQDKIDVEIIQENGSVILTPALNWFGTEYITFSAKDSSQIEATQTVEVTVHPTNDLPRIVQIGNQIVLDDSSELGFTVNQNEDLLLRIDVDDIDGDVERGMIQYVFNKTETNKFYFDTYENKLLIRFNNADVGIHYFNVSVTDNNATPPEFVTQNIRVEVLNINDRPTVEIVAPLRGAEFLETDDVLFMCQPEDPDLLIPNPTEKFSYEWYTNKSSYEKLGVEQNITVANKTLIPGYHLITVVIEDSGGFTAYDTVDIVIKEVPKKQVANGDKETATDDLLWLWIMILAIIVIVALLFIVATKRKKRKLEELGIPQKQALTPDGAYKQDLSMATLAQASETTQMGQLGEPPQPQVMQPQPIIDSEPLTPPAPQQELPTETAIVTPSLAPTTPTMPAFAQAPQLPPAKPLDKDPEVSATIQSPVPTVVSPPSTPTIATAPSISPGLVVHLPDSKPQPTLETSTQPKPQTKNTNQITQ